MSGFHKRGLLWAALLALCGCQSVSQNQTSGTSSQGSAPPVVLPPAVFNSEAQVDAISFGSCADQKRAQPIWNQVLLKKPSLHLALGDNIYTPDEAGPAFANGYAQLLTVAEFVNFRNLIPILPTWDDHDFGRKKDGGRDNPDKNEARDAYMQFWINVPDEVRSRGGAVYSSFLAGPEGKKVHLILLDTRWNRSPLKEKAHEKFRYDPSDAEEQDMLGEEQWDWLVSELKKPAQFRVLASSIQVLSDKHPFEKWGNLPKERKRLLSVLEKSRRVPTLVVSGDRHFAEVSRWKTPQGMNVIEVTSSSLNKPGSIQQEVNPYRVGPLVTGANFGLIELDWKKKEARAGIYKENGQVQTTVRIPLK